MGFGAFPSFPFLSFSRCLALIISQAAVLKPAQREGGYVVYEVHLHPTYRMPCLWFRLHDLPNGDDPLNIDTVFHYLVPREYKDGLRRYGSIGGISLDVSLLFCIDG